MVELSIDRNATDAERFRSSPARYAGLAIGLPIFIWAIASSPKAFDQRLVTFATTSTARLLMIECVVGLIVAGCLFLIVRPVELIANGSGFCMRGGFVLSAGVQSWTDIEQIFVVSAGHTRRIACALKPGAMRRFPARRGASDAQAILAGFFPANPEQVVAQLNALRERAVGRASLSLHAISQGRTNPRLAVKAETIRASRVIYLTVFVITLLPLGLLLLAYVKTGIQWDRMMFFWTVVAVPTIASGALWLVCRPPVLTLDGTGFTMAGGFTRSPKALSWRDVETFFVDATPPNIYLPRIAFAGRPDANGRMRLRGVFRWFFVTHPDGIVNRLNEYRERALQLGSQ